MERVFKFKELISVIIPIYNVEEYLERCINSVINQTYKNIEIILVDDGSSDRCGMICDKYAEKENRIKVLHKKNGGLSDARNSGIEVANGEYITFIDSDDYVSCDYVEYLYYILKKYNTRISCCGHYICFHEKNISKSSLIEKKISKIEALKDILYDKEIDICSWGKLYDSKLFENIKFPKGKLFEDTATTYLLFDLCDNISIGNKCKYHYVMRDNSITSQIFNLKKMDLIEMTNQMCYYIVTKYPMLKAACNRRKIWAYMSTYVKIIYTKRKEFYKEKEYIKDYIKKNRKNVLKDKEISKRDIISLKIFALGDYVFKFSWKIYKTIFN